MAKKAASPRKPRRKKAQPVKLDLGAGDIKIPGYTPIDRKDGQEAYPLDVSDGSVDEIRASHILEHFPHKASLEVVKSWYAKLKEGGLLKVGVPDFDWLVKLYENGVGNLPFEGFLMGGQVDGNDFHMAIFNRDKLWTLLKLAGFRDIRRWRSEVQDCASMPLSLNLQGTKPTQARLDAIEASRPKRVFAAMSTPRLGFMDNHFCAFQSLPPLKIKLKKHTGAYYGQCMERCMNECVRDGADAILTLDYDTVFKKDDVERLLDLMAEHPEADAISTIQQHRSRPTPLMTILGENGKAICEVPAERFEADLQQIHTAHFGLTLIRVSSLVKMPHPWYCAQPDKNGGWDDGRIDADIWFWKRWHEIGNKLFLANRIPIGHAELMFLWPGRQLRPTFQHPNDFYTSGRPADVWR